MVVGECVSADREQNTAAVGEGGWTAWCPGMKRGSRAHRDRSGESPPLGEEQHRIYRHRCRPVDERVEVKAESHSLGNCLMESQLLLKRINTWQEWRLIIQNPLVGSKISLDLSESFSALLWQLCSHVRGAALALLPVPSYAGCPRPTHSIHSSDIDPFKGHCDQLTPGLGDTSPPSLPRRCCHRLAQGPTVLGLDNCPSSCGVSGPTPHTYPGFPPPHS